MQKAVDGHTFGDLYSREDKAPVEFAIAHATIMLIRFLLSSAAAELWTPHYRLVEQPLDPNGQTNDSVLQILDASNYMHWINYSGKQPQPLSLFVNKACG